MELKKINDEIDAVIDRLQELESKEYREKYGIEVQRNTRKIVSNLFKDLLIKRQQYYKKVESKEDEDIYS